MSRDLRKYARQTNVRLIIGGIVILFLIGDGLIYLFYGQGAALLGLICIAIGLLPPILVGIALWILGWLVKKVDQGE